MPGCFFCMNLGHVAIKCSPGLGLLYSKFIAPCIDLSIYDPGTSGAPETISVGLWNQNYFHSIIKTVSAPFTLMIVWWSFPEAIGDTTVNWMQKQIWESCCLLLSQTLKRFANIKQCFCLFALELYGVLNNFEERKAAWDQTIWEPLVCGSASVVPSHLPLSVGGILFFWDSQFREALGVGVGWGERQSLSIKDIDLAKIR